MNMVKDRKFRTAISSVFSAACSLVVPVVAMAQDVADVYVSCSIPDKYEITIRISERTVHEWRGPRGGWGDLCNNDASFESDLVARRCSVTRDSIMFDMMAHTLSDRVYADFVTLYVNRRDGVARFETGFSRSGVRDVHERGNGTCVAVQNPDTGRNAF